jgi:hypothetical protein
MKHIAEELKKVITATCDFCGVSSLFVCCKCKKDLCKEHVELHYYDYNENGASYCHQCWDIGYKYREAINNVKKSCDDKIEKLEQEWADECIKSGT